MCVQVESQSDEIDVSSSLAVTEQTALYSISAGHLGKLGSSNTASTVVVGMQGDTNILSVANVVAEVFDQIGVDVGCRQFYCGGEVQDDLVALGRVRSPSSLDSLADSHGIVRVCVGEALGGELELPVGARGLRVILCQRSDQLGALYSKLQGLLLSVAKDYLTEACACGKVDVNDGVLSTTDRLDGSANEVGSTGGQDL